MEAAQAVQLTGSLCQSVVPEESGFGDQPSGERKHCALRTVTENDYECKTRPDALAFRNRTNARPRSPVPSKSRLLGSGVGVSPMKV